MPLRCPKCEKDSLNTSRCSNFVRFGSYYRTSDSRLIQRYRCNTCLKAFSSATFHPCYRQKKRKKNEPLRKLLSSCVSLRRAAKILNVHRITVERKLLFLAKMGAINFHKGNREAAKTKMIEFDDLETFEHTKCKPLSVTIAVESKTRRILGFEVSQMPAKGLLVGKAKKYGLRLDTRTTCRRRLFHNIQGLMELGCEIKSDENPHYKNDVKEIFPLSPYKQFKGQRGSLGGQGELKKIAFDPLFSLNHTCAMLRANINRLVRKTWCTTKRPDRLYAHLMLYADFHNSQLIGR